MKKLTAEQYAEKYMDAPFAALNESEARDFPLPKRARVSHKYSYGRALVIAGSRGFAGAPVLAANAAERGGAGLTRLLVPEGIYTAAALRCDGAVVTPLPENEAGSIAPAALPELLSALELAGACVIGPGLGTKADSRELVKTVLNRADCPLVLDADALTVAAREPELLESCRVPLILTPHGGEFRRLGGDVSRGRLRGALDFTEKHKNLILILKGYGSLICRDGEAVVNPTGGPAMAKGGSGDVLCGILCALLAQGFEPWFAARAAVWLHGFAGDLAEEELGEYSLAPSDLIRFLPKAFQTLCIDSKN